MTPTTMSFYNCNDVTSFNGSCTPTAFKEPYKPVITSKGPYRPVIIVHGLMTGDVSTMNHLATRITEVRLSKLLL